MNTMLPTTRNRTRATDVAGTTRLGRHGVTLVKIIAITWMTLAFTVEPIRASDPIGVFAVIDKVEMEPAKGKAERIRIWGTFTIAGQGPGSKRGYKPPESGYIYYKLPAEKADVARIEWNDLKAMAGTGKVIGYGARRERKTGKRVSNGTVHTKLAKDVKPDTYQLGYGLVRLSQRGGDYSPIKRLREQWAKENEKQKAGTLKKKKVKSSAPAATKSKAKTKTKSKAKQ